MTFPRDVYNLSHLLLLNLDENELKNSKEMMYGTVGWLRLSFQD